ncbi:MAG: hypothetical protein DGJ47_000845 [Rickettsiaceae bacterium]
MKIKSLRIILMDQLSHTISSLKGCDKEHDLILIPELLTDFTYVKHHKKKIILLLSAMRHFVFELKDKGYKVRHIKLTDKNNTQTLLGEIEKIEKEYHIDNIIVSFPGEYRVLACLKKIKKSISTPLKLIKDNRFLIDAEGFQEWAGKKKQLRMEFFYRHMRQKHEILMRGDKPVGGKWNYDFENRQSPKEQLEIPDTYQSKPNEITQEVIHLVEKKFADHFGDTENFHFAINRQQALTALEQFIKYRLSDFGKYQDAMIEDEPWMYHSHLSFYLNCGLLMPLECIHAAEEAYYKDLAPLNSVEGFIRQILGWREYVRGIYWLKMPQYEEENFFNAKNKLPEFYWNADTKMNCIKQCVIQTKETAYAHHIQRLMVLGNFALLTAIDPKYVNEWYLIVYADAYQWVELPNVSGMILFADGGDLASKPYAAGGSYINKMSDYCKKCHYKVTKKNGEDACPFNYLYWDFLVRNRDKLNSNPRISMMYRIYDKMSNEKQQAILNDSNKFIKSLPSYL